MKNSESTVYIVCRYMKYYLSDTFVLMYNKDVKTHCTSKISAFVSMNVCVFEKDLLLFPVYRPALSVTAIHSLVRLMVVMVEVWSILTSCFTSRLRQLDRVPRQKTPDQPHIP